MRHLSVINYVIGHWDQPKPSAPLLLSDFREEERTENGLVTNLCSEATGAGEMAQSIKCVLRKHEDLVTKAHVTTLGIVAHTCNLSAGVTVTGGSLGLSDQSAEPTW